MIALARSIEPNTSTICARVLQHEAAVAHLDAEFGRDLLQARGQHEAPAADHVVEEIDHRRGGGGEGTEDICLPSVRGEAAD
jgi:hypothetical protein